MTSEDVRFGRRVLRHLGALVARTATTSAVTVVFVAATVGAMLAADDTRWMARVQTVATVLSLVLLLALHHTQHRDQIALQRKLDELLQADDGADNELMRLEAASDETLDRVDERHGELANR
jgi:low affinity Fe/Cu permease